MKYIFTTIEFTLGTRHLTKRGATKFKRLVFFTHRRALTNYSKLYNLCSQLSTPRAENHRIGYPLLHGCSIRAFFSRIAAHLLPARDFQSKENIHIICCCMTETGWRGLSDSTLTIAICLVLYRCVCWGSTKRDCDHQEYLICVWIFINFCIIFYGFS